MNGGHELEHATGDSAVMLPIASESAATAPTLPSKVSELKTKQKEL